MSRVALNTWWTQDPNQRYWMEISARPDVGGPLESPKLERLTWGYDLVSQVQSGDRVLHWSTIGTTSALVGWSEVVAYPVVVPEYTWTPRHGEERTTAGWRAELGGLHRFPPITAAQLLPLLDEITTVDEALGNLHPGTLYFPFTRYGAERPIESQEIRAAQAYFVKFPVELFDVIPGAAGARIDGAVDPLSVTVAEDFQKPGKWAANGRVTRASDPKLRRAMERRSLEVAREYYEALGGSEYREVGAPYDIEVVVDGVVRHCEVKGSSLVIDTVELTINEVIHAGDFPLVDLIVVDGIVPVRDESNEVIDAVGGRLRVWTNWSPVEDALKAMKFAYSLPGSSETA